MPRGIYSLFHWFKRHSIKMANEIHEAFFEILFILF